MKSKKFIKKHESRPQAARLADLSSGNDEISSNLNRVTFRFQVGGIPLTGGETALDVRINLQTNFVNVEVEITSPFGNESGESAADDLASEISASKHKPVIYGYSPRKETGYSLEGED